MSNNGYSESLFPTTDGVCYICGLHTETARHEVFPGANRKNSKAWGMWYNTCPACHDRWHLYDRGLVAITQADGQRLFEEKYSRDSFIRIFGRSYL